MGDAYTLDVFVQTVLNVGVSLGINFTDVTDFLQPNAFG